MTFTLNLCPKSTQFGKRVMVRNGKPIFFSDSKKTNYQASVALLANEHRPSSPMKGAIYISLRFILPRPKCLMSAKHKEGLLLCDKRPDWDNLSKGTIDALTQCGFWSDDGQIASATIQKWYAEKKGNPRIEVIIIPTL